MRKLLVSTTALSVAISPLGTMPGFAQALNGDGSITGADGAVLCATIADPGCDITAIVEALRATDPAAADALQLEIDAKIAADAAAQAEAEAAAQAAAEAEAAAQAEAEAAAQAAAEAEAAAQAEAEAAAQATAEAEAAAQAEAEAAAQAAAEAEAAAQAEADAAAQAAAEAEAAAQAEAEGAAQAAADAEAAAQAAADAEAAAAAQAAADAEAAAAQAATDAEAAAAQAATDAEAAAAQDAADAEAAAAAQAEADAAAAAQAAADAEAAAAEAAAAEAAPVVEEAPAVDAAEPEVVVEADRNEIVEDASGLLPEPSVDTMIEALGEGAIDPATGAPLDAAAAAAAAAALAAAEAEIQVSDTGEVIDPAAGLKTAEVPATDPAEAVDAPVVSETEVESLTQLLTADPTAIDPETIGAAAVVTAAPAEGGTVDLAPAESADLIGSVTERIARGAVRTSADEFAAAPVRRDDGRKSGLSNLEKAGLVVLGALAVGAIIKSNNDRQEERRVVSNTGDRVIMLLPDGSYQVLKDDDAVIRQPGSTVRTETFNDGSTRTIVEREDGTQVVTIRDATGRVLRRAAYDERGREIVLIDDLQREEVVNVADLPRPKKRIVISSKDNDAALKRELAAIEAERAGRTFSLRQIREIPQVRALAATIDVEPVTFATGSAAIAASEARNLADLGRVMQDLLDLNPGEVFLIEGHTDATGRAALNLALSDRRAESVALALTEYFDIPPENMVVQGYGETELLIDTQESEPANRRVEVRVVTPLMRTAELR
jgi:outer membrane protein OmpA-like peptidoglycan-associated protein